MCIKYIIDQNICVQVWLFSAVSIVPRFYTRRHKGIIAYDKIQVKNLFFFLIIISYLIYLLVIFINVIIDQNISVEVWIFSAVSIVPRFYTRRHKGIIAW